MGMDFNVNVNVKTNGAEKIDALEKQINSLKTESIKLKVDVDQSSLSKLKLNTNSTKIKPTVDTSGIKQTTKDFQMVKNLATQISQTKIKIAGLDTTKNANEISVLQNQLRKMESDYKVLMKTLGGSFDKSQLGNLENIFGKADDKIAQINAKAKDLGVSMQAAIKPFNQLDATIAGNKTLTWLKNNSKAAKDYGEVLTTLAEKQKNATNADELKEYTKQVNKIKTEAAAAGKTGNSFLADTKRAFGQIFQFTTVYGTLQRIPQVLNQMTNAVIEIDTAMTNLKKVTDETDARYSEFLTNASQNAKSLGRDVSSYITQTSEWAKLGYSMNSSSELAKVSSIYANVGEVDDKTAVSDLVTVMKAYNMQDSQAMDIADMLNELGNNYATSAGDLGAGLTKMASTMSMSNVSLEKSLAILTGGTEITQNAEELGNAIKVSVLRMRGQKGALEDIGENADDIESVSKMQTQILNMTKGAVNIMDSADPTKFRDYYDVMADIAEVLPKLSETDRANLIETLFGKNRANQGQAILQAFQSGQIQKAYQTALNSAGSAQKEQDRWMQSAEAKIQQFKAQFQDLSSSAINSDFLKGAIDAGTKLLEILTQIIDVGGGIPAVLGAIGGVALFKNLD